MTHDTIIEQFTVKDDDPRLVAIARVRKGKGNKVGVACGLHVGDKVLSMDLPHEGQVAPNFLYPDGWWMDASDLVLLPWRGSDARYEVQR